MRNRRISSLAKSAALLTLCIATASALAGCGGQDKPGRMKPSTNSPAETAAEESADGPDLGAGLPSAPDSSGPTNDPQLSNVTKISSDDTGVEPNAAGGEPHMQPDHNGWLQEPPALRGIALGSRADDVRDLLGEPQDEYSLPDSLTILEYDGLTAGIGDDGLVRFIEIHGEDVETGIEQLAVGSAAEDAITALGEPASHTPVVLLYERDDARLKFDLDPETKRIAAIRLYIEE